MTNCLRSWSSEEDREAFSNETHIVEFDKYGSGKIEVSFGQVELVGDKKS